VNRIGRARSARDAHAPWLPRRAAAVAMAIGATLPIAGCGVFGSGAGVQAPALMTVNSSAFIQNTMPATYTCGADGKEINPPLGWAGAPPGTKSLALIIDDSDAPITPYVYWIVFDINPATSEILEGQLPPGARQARNSMGAAAYDPPCPGPHGHEYRFTVYALNKVLNLPPGTSLDSAWTAIAAATIGRGRLTANATTLATAVTPTT
jgi:Raf kinase inhibitor-like YbhB/YbcL family protein